MKVYNYFILILATFLIMVIAGTCLGQAATSPSWQPAPEPLMTRWANNVGPDKVLPEYPRPMMVREKWANLNGLWDYAVTSRGAFQHHRLEELGLC